MMAKEEPIWRIERHGIEPLPAQDRAGSLRDVFWIWFGANIAVLGVVLGAVVMDYGLSLWQGILVTIAGAFSFALVGALAVPGARLGIPTLTIARATFGVYGNLLPTAVAWLNLVGWEVIVLVTATYALEGALGAAWVGDGTKVLMLAAFLAVLLLAFAAALLGYRAVARLQQVFSYVFGLLTLPVFAFLLPRTDWGALLQLRPAPWIGGVLPALSVVVAGTGLSWVTAASDYTRYLPQATPAKKVVSAVTWGSMVPVALLMLLGVMISHALPGLASAANPISLIGAVLPSWMATPYLAAAVGGLITELVLATYSSGLSLLAAGVPLPRYKTILVDATLAIAGSLYLLYWAQNFAGPFISFLTVVAGLLAPWAGVFWVDTARRLRQDFPTKDLYKGSGSRYGRVRWRALVAYLLGVLVSLLMTSSPLFTGPWARGIFQGSSLGYFVGMAVSALLAAIPPLRGPSRDLGHLPGDGSQDPKRRAGGDL